MTKYTIKHEILLQTVIHWVSMEEIPNLKPNPISFGAPYPKTVSEKLYPNSNLQNPKSMNIRSETETLPSLRGSRARDPASNEHVPSMHADHGRIYRHAIEESTVGRIAKAPPAACVCVAWSETVGPHMAAAAGGHAVASRSKPQRRADASSGGERASERSRERRSALLPL